MREFYQAFAEAGKLNRKRGFTLIELLVVIAIIAILAAIAIPQFARYRMKAYNGAAESDVRNMATAEEALYADNQVYGTSELSTLAAVTGSGGTGSIVSGPIGPATPTQTGAAVAGQIDSDGDGTPDQPIGVGYGVSRGVDTRADTEAAGSYASYIIVAHHDQGNTAFAKDSDSTAIYRCVNDAFINNPTPPGGSFPGGLNIPAPTVDADDLNGTNCGGSPVANWIAQ